MIFIFSFLFLFAFKYLILISDRKDQRDVVGRVLALNAGDPGFKPWSNIIYFTFECGSPGAVQKLRSSLGPTQP